MPRKKKPDNPRVNFRCEGWFSDLLEKAAAADDRSMSAFIRQACVERMKAMGIEVCPAEGQLPAKKLGRPRKPKAG